MEYFPRLEEDPWFGNFVLNVNFWLSFDVVTIPQGPNVLLPGTLLTAAGAATGGADAAAILVNRVNPSAGPTRALAVTRQAEVRDAGLLYGEGDRDATNASLAEHGIIVRLAVLSDSIVTPPSVGSMAAAAAAPEPEPQS